MKIFDFIKEKLSQLFRRLYKRRNKKFIRKFDAQKMLSIGRLRKVRDWQRRERALPHIIQQSRKHSHDQANMIHKIIKKQFKYVTDLELYRREEYWETSEEIKNKKKGDCDGFAVWMWSLLHQCGFPKDDIGMVVVYGHMFAALHIGINDFIVYDNGFIANKPIKASELFPIWRKNHKLMPMYGFNMNKIWRYEIR